MRDVASRALRASSHTTAVDRPGPGRTSQRRLLSTSIPASMIASNGVSSLYTTVTPRSMGIGSERTRAWPIRSARSTYVPGPGVRKSNRPAAFVRRESSRSPSRLRSMTEAPSTGAPVSASTKIPEMAWAPSGAVTNRIAPRHHKKMVTRNEVRTACRNVRKAFRRTRESVPEPAITNSPDP